MQEMCLDVIPSPELITCDNYYWYNMTEKNAISVLKDREIGSWILRFDYITKQYYLTIKSNNLEYINHTFNYCKKTDGVYIYQNGKPPNESTKIVFLYSSLKEFLIHMQNIYDFNLLKQIVP